MSKATIALINAVAAAINVPFALEGNWFNVLAVGLNVGMILGVLATPSKEAK